MSLHQTTLLVFDMDGVLLDSNEIKHEAMLRLFDVDSESRLAIDRYNRRAGGVPRNEKFAHIWTEILGRDFNEEVQRTLGQEYERSLEDNLWRADLLPGIVDFIAHSGCQCFVCTSAPVEEAKALLKRKAVVDLFQQVFGAPMPKPAALAAIAAQSGSLANQVVFFGDAMADLQAARTAGASFIGVTGDRDNFGSEEIPKIAGFVDREPLWRALDRLGCEGVVFHSRRRQ